MSFSNGDEFLSARRDAWRELETLLAGSGGLKKKAPADISRLGRLYRELCTDRMRAERLGVSPTTLHYLDALTSRAHAVLYDTGERRFRGFGAFLWGEFPRALRANSRFFWLSTLLFLLPFVVCLARSLASPRFAADVLPLDVLENMADAYQKDPSHGRTSGTNAAMAGFYVYNNVGIAFRCFATGILFGLGSAFFLIYNGAVTGAIVGHVIRTGGGWNILTFVATHAPLEITAIIISGGAGLAMGHALLETRGKTRLGSLWDARHGILAQVVGAALLLFLAALVEGFWSPSNAPPVVKWWTGGGLLVLVTLYLGWAGRRRSA